MTSSDAPTTAPTTAPRSRLRTARPLAYVVAALVLAHLVWTVPGVRPDAPGFRVLPDGVLQGSAYTLVAVLAAVWARRPPASVPASWCVVAALGLRALGFVLTLTFLGVGDPLPYPSVADLAWTASSVMLIIAVVLRVRDLAPRLPLLVVLDAFATSLLLIGTASHFLQGPLQKLTEAPGAAVESIAFNLVYPVLDVALLVALAALISAGRGRLRPADWLLAAAASGLALVDVTYFALLAEGLWRPGSPLAGVSLLSTAVLALAVALAPGRTTVPRRLLGQLPEKTAAPGVVIPATMVAVAVLGLAFTSVTQSASATLPFVAAALVAVARGVTTFLNDRETATTVLGVATTDLHQFQALVEASSDLIGMSDSEGNILYLNPGGRRLLRMPTDRDVRSLTVAEVVPGAGDASFSKRWPLLLERGTWEGESELVPLDGSTPIPVAISTFVMYDSGARRPFALATIQRDIRDIRRQEAVLRDVADQRARLLGRLVRAQEAERSQIAADVHDDSVQALAVVDLRMGMLRRRIARRAPELLDTVDDVQQAVSAATDRLRHLLFDLESPAREAGLRSALTTAAEVVFADTDVVWQVTGDEDLGLGDAERITAYRVAMEAMVNARKHAGAQHVTLTLLRGDEELLVTVRDDGRGIRAGDEQERPGHQGLASMRDRALVAGGELRVGPTPEGGTEVRLSLPVLPAPGVATEDHDSRATPSASRP